MAAHSNGQTILFCSCGYYLLLFPRLFSVVGDRMCTILPHIMISFPSLSGFHQSGATKMCVSHRRHKMYIGHTVCVSVCLSLAAFPHYCKDPDVTWGNCRGCLLVVHYWADLQSVHGFHCYDNIART